MRRLCIGTVAAIVVAACGSQNPVAPSQSRTPSPAAQNSTFADFPVVDGVSCPSDAPLFSVDANSAGHLDVTVQLMPQADFVRVFVARREVTNDFIPVAGSPFAIDGGRTYTEIPVGPGVYEVRVATVTCGELRNLSAAIIAGISGPTADPSQPEGPGGEEENPEQPTSYVSYWAMNQGTENARRHACENHGGEYLGTYNIPGDGTLLPRLKVCRIVSSTDVAAAVTPTGNASSLYLPPGFVTQ